MCGFQVTLLLLLCCVLMMYVCLCLYHRRMTTHLLTFYITFGGKGNINTINKTNLKVVKVYPILFDQEVSEELLRAE